MLYTLYCENRHECCLELCSKTKEQKYFCKMHNCIYKNCNLQKLGGYKYCFNHLTIIKK